MEDALLFDDESLDEETRPESLLRILLKSGTGRLTQEWHYHLANATGRPRCGALLNLREWHVRAVAQPPNGLCARCARLLGPRPKVGGGRIVVRRSIDKPATAAQIELPLDDTSADDDLTNGELSMITLPAYADEFLLRPDIAFFNHGSFGACPRPVFDTYQRWQRELEEQPVEFLSRRINDLLERARSDLAIYLGTQADNLVYVPNATYGMNIVARSLKLEPGDEVLSTDHEYGAANRTWRFNCRQRGAIYINQPIDLPPASVDAFVEQLWAGVTPRTKVIFLSHITSPTALIFPVAEVCRRAREQGIMTVIDGAHAPGQIDLDMEAIGADFYTGNCHKWLCAQRASGFLYARSERKALLEPLVVSWGWESLTPERPVFQDLFEWPGTHSPAAYLTVPTAIQYQADRNWPEVRAACHRLLLDISERVIALTGLPATSLDNEDWVQLRAFRLPPCNMTEVKTRLWEEYQVEVPLVDFNGQILLRVSVQCYNSPEDADRLLNALAAVLPRAEQEALFS